MQQSLNNESKLGDWLSSKGLKNNAQALAEKLKIDAGMECRARSSALGAKLNALNFK